jgi:hypothetical protein
MQICVHAEREQRDKSKSKFFALFERRAERRGEVFSVSGYTTMFLFASFAFHAEKKYFHVYTAATAPAAAARCEKFK